MKSKRVLFLLSRFLDGGIDTVLVEYVNSMCRLTQHHVTLAIAIDYGYDSEVFLSRLNANVEVVHLVSNSVLTYRKRKAHHNEKNKIISVLDELLLNPIRRFIIGKRLNSLFKSHDVIIDFDCCFSSFMHYASDKTKTISFSHFSIAQAIDDNKKRRNTFHRRFSCYNHIVTIIGAMQIEAQSLFPDIAERFVCIYNPCNPHTLFDLASCKVEDNRINSNYIIAVERLEENQKDISTLIKAYSILNKENIADLPKLYIIGEGRSRQLLENLIHSSQLEDKVELLGFIANPYPWIANSQMLVHSSKFEGFGLVLLEALMLGKIVVATDCPVGPSEILDNGRAGVLVTVGNAKALAESLSTLLGDETLCKGILEYAQNHCQKFYPESSISQLEQLFC